MTLTRTIRIPKFGGDANRDTHRVRPRRRQLPRRHRDLASTAAAPGSRRTKPNIERGLLIGPDLDSDNTVRDLVVELDLADATACSRAIDLDNSDSAVGARVLAARRLPASSRCRATTR